MNLPQDSLETYRQLIKLIAAKSWAAINGGVTGGHLVGSWVSINSTDRLRLKFNVKLVTEADLPNGVLVEMFYC